MAKAESSESKEEKKSRRRFAGAPKNNKYIKNDGYGKIIMKVLKCQKEKLNLFFKISVISKNVEENKICSTTKNTGRRKCFPHFLV